jgi:hypothetical protein
MWFIERKQRALKAIAEEAVPPSVSDDRATPLHRHRV